MNMKRLFSSKKGMSGAIASGIIILALAFLVASVSYMVPVLAIHDSTVTVIPNITAGDVEDLMFTATVTAGEDTTIHEFRVYESGDFSDLTCDVKAGWYGPYYGTTTFGNYCQWNAQVGNEIEPEATETFTWNLVILLL